MIGFGKSAPAAAALAAHAADLSLHSSGRDLAYVERTTALTGANNTAYADTVLPIPDFTVGVRPVYVELFVSNVQLSASAIPVFALTTSAGVVIAEQQMYMGVAFGQVPFRLEHRITAAATYSGYKIQHKVNSGQSFTIRRDAGSPVAARVRVFEA